jgi:ACT domain
VLTRMRIWLPDEPGVLGAVAAAIGTAKGNVVGLEVLEREAGVAVDEIVVELPDDPAAVDAVCRGVRHVPGAGVETVTELHGEAGAMDREDSVLAAAAGILQAASPQAALQALTGHLLALFHLDWMALADDDLEGYVDAHGDVPPIRWLAAFTEGSRSGADPAIDTTGSGVFVEPVPDTGYTVCGGRASPIRRRERHEIALLAMVAGRFVDALRSPQRSDRFGDHRVPGT